MASEPPALSTHGLAAILSATAVALLATPLAAPAMPEMARLFAGQAQHEPFARALLWSIGFLGAPNASFLVKFILLSVPALFIMVGSPIAGWMCDRWGRKALLNASLFVMGLAGVSGYFADTFLFLFVSRAVLGLAIAGIKTATVAMIGDYYDGPKRQKVIGWQGSATKFGSVVFLLLGGWLAGLSWRLPFLGYALAFLVLPSAFFVLRESRPRIESASPGQGADPALTAAPFWPCAFVVVSATLASGLFFITPVELPFFLTKAFGASPFQTGFAVAVGNTVAALVALTYHRFRTRLNYVAIYAVIFLSMAAGYYVLTLMPGFASSLIGMVVGGVGFGLYIPNHSSWILAVVGPGRRGFGVGLVTTAMFLGQALAPMLVEPLSDPADPHAVWRSVSAILLVLAVLYGLLARMRVASPGGQGRQAVSTRSVLRS